MEKQPFLVLVTLVPLPATDVLTNNLGRSQSGGAGSPGTPVPLPGCPGSAVAAGAVPRSRAHRTAGCGIPAAADWRCATVVPGRGAEFSFFFFNHVCASSEVWPKKGFELKFMYFSLLQNPLVFFSRLL